jgi:uncharacterized protein (TIGR02284 family)
MEPTPQHTIEGLNHLITIAADGEHGYRIAAEHATNPVVKALCLKHAEQRAGFVTGLRALVRAVDGDPDAGSGPVGALHRAWIDIKTAVTSNDDKAVLAECVRGEQAAIAAYETELKENNYTSGQRTILQQQLKLVHEALLAAEQEMAKLV